jgi:release factor glutamine methyltransferase
VTDAAVDRVYTVAELIGRSAAYLDAKGFGSPRLDAEVLLADVLDMRRLDLYLHHDRPLEPAETDRYRAALRRRASGEPVAYILGRRAFRSLTLAVDARVLVPRPETESVVEVALGLLPAGGRLLDVGTGSGAIALSAALERPDAVVAATDVSAEALEVAVGNAATLGLDVSFRLADLVDGLPQDERYDVVVANLPYIADDDPDLDAAVRAHEPAVALFGGDGGLGLVRRLVDTAPAVLAPGGALILEIGFRQGDAVRALLEAGGYEQVRLDRDLSGLDRVVSGRVRAEGSDG